MAVGLDLFQILTLTFGFNNLCSIIIYMLAQGCLSWKFWYQLIMSSHYTRINKVKETICLHSLDIFKVVHVDVNQMLVSFE